MIILLCLRLCCSCIFSASAVFLQCNHDDSSDSTIYHHYPSLSDSRLALQPALSWGTEVLTSGSARTARRFGGEAASIQYLTFDPGPIKQEEDEEQVQ